MNPHLKGRKILKKLITSGVLVAALVAPAAASAQDQPTPAQFKNAAKYCKALKAFSGGTNFATMFGTKKNAYGKCVSQTAKQTAREDAKQEQQAKSNAAKDCKAERDDANFAASHDGKTFNQFYGSNKNGKNAYGKCVSQKAKAKKKEADQQDAQQQQNKLNAAKACRTEKNDANFAAGHDGKSFADFYGTNANKKNAFGKCVSKKAREKNDQQQS